MKFIIMFIIGFLSLEQPTWASQVIRLNTRQNILSFAEILDNNNVPMTASEIREMVNIIGLVERIGIPVIYDSNLTDVCGYVESRGKQFVIGKPVLREACGPIIETFRHEGFHVVQLCASENGKVLPIGIDVSERAIREMNSTDTPYPNEVKPLEAEAFESELIPGLTVEGLRYCLGD